MASIDRPRPWRHDGPATPEDVFLPRRAFLKKNITACRTISSGIAAGARTGRTGRTGRTITAQVQGGELELDWTSNDHIMLTGPAVEVFTGTWPPTPRP